MPVLPSELIPLILSNLSKQEQYECMKVCRLWYSEASSRFYKEIIWRGSRNEKLLELVKKPLIDGKKIGDYATKIELSAAPHSYPGLQIHEFETVIDNLFKLEVIHARDIYIEYLYYIPVYKLSRLQEISLDDMDSGDSYAAKKHYLANTRLRNQITTLKFSFGNVSINVDPDAIIRDLSSFTHLKNLVIFSYRIRPVAANQEHLISFVLNTCHNLTCLEVQTRWTWITDRAASARHTNLMSLKVFIPGLHQEHIECIMRCAPNLKALCFFADSYFYENMSSMEETSELILYFRKLEYLEVSTATTASLFWDFWKNVCGKECSCDLTVTVVRLGQDSYDMKLINKRQNLKLICFIESGVTGVEYWTNRLNFLSFNSVRLDIKQAYMGCTGSYEIWPVLYLLKQQQEECAIEIGNNLQVIYFDSVPIESKEVYKKERKRLDIKYGYIRGFLLENELLNYLGTLYPSIQHLTLKDCLSMQENNKRNTYYMDLTQFKKIQLLECDFLFGFRRTENDCTQALYPVYWNIR